MNKFLITEIKRIKGHLYILFDGDAEIARLDAALVAETGIDKGNELSQEELDTLVTESEKRRAKEKAFWILSFRDHSEKELRQKLSKDFSEESIDFVIDLINEYGLINDLEFARKNAQYMINSKNYSLRRAEFELRQKGIEPETVRLVLDNMNIDDQNQIYNIIEKKYLPLPREDKEKRKIINSLSRLGFSYDDIRHALREHEDG